MLCKVFLRHSDKTEPKTSQSTLVDQICNMSTFSLPCSICVISLHNVMLPSLPQIVSAGTYQAGMSVGNLKVAKGNLIVREHYCAILLCMLYVLYIKEHYWHTVWLPQLNALINKPLSICA